MTMSAFVNILNNIDPDAVIAVVGLVGSWLWSKHKGEKTKSAREMLDDVVRQVINSADVDLENVKARAEQACRAALAKVGITGATSDRLVHEFAEYAAAELAERWGLFQKRLDQLAVNAAKAAAV
jgi:hypothetical protein